MIPAVTGATGGTPTVPYQWVVVGTTGVTSKLFTSVSPTASSWTERTSSFGSNIPFSVASNQQMYVACGSAGTVASSPDGITWTQRTSGFSTTNVNCVAYGNGYWVIVGVLGKASYSTDGITWTSINGLGISVTEDLNVIAYGNGLWVVAGDAGGMWTTTDPTASWTARTSTLGRIQWPNALHYAQNQSIWVAGNDTGTTGALASSTDGLTWTARNSTISGNQGTSAFANNSSVIIHAVDAATPDVESSTNGTTYTNRTPAVAQKPAAAATDDANLIALATYSSSSKIQTTTDGTTWTDRGIVQAGTYLTAICHSAGTPSIR